MKQQTSPVPSARSKPLVSQGAAQDAESRHPLTVEPSSPVALPGAAHRETMIREAAYFRAEHREFDPGHELEDWLAAEREIDWLLALRACYPPVAC